MKQLELQLKKRLLILEIDESLETLNIHSWNNQPLELICKGSELTEEIAKTIIPNELGYLFDGDNKEYFAYPDYKNINHPFEDNSFKTATESFISAIEAHGNYWSENSLRKPEYSIEWYDRSKIEFERYENDIQEWQEAESKTFNPEKTLIFEILL